MGEYFKGIKLGTCENLYYARLSDVQALLGAGEYADPRNGYRYRFPFPEEDGTPVGQYQEYDKGLRIYFTAADLPDLYAELHSDRWDHINIYHHVSGPNCNIIIPCIYSPAFAQTGLKTSSPGTAIDIKQQKQVDGEVWTVVACSACGALIRLDRDAAFALAAYIEKHYTHQGDYYAEVANRIRSGYHN